MRTRQWIQASILLFTGLYFLDNMLSGRIYLYINERFGWLTWLGTITLLVLGAVNVVDLLKTRPEPEHAHAGHDHAGHEHHHHDNHEHSDHDHSGHDHAPTWTKLAIVGVPLIIGLVIPAKPLGAAAVQNSGVSTGFSSGGATTTQLSVASTERNVLDWVRAFNGTADVKTFDGQKADLIGFVYRDIRFDEKTHFMVARFAISCCVADASAIGVIVQTTDAAKWQQDGWVHVRGKFQAQMIEDRQTPVLIADSVEQVAQPDHPYLYP